MESKKNLNQPEDMYNNFDAPEYLKPEAKEPVSVNSQGPNPQINGSEILPPAHIIENKPKTRPKLNFNFKKIVVISIPAFLGALLLGVLIYSFAFVGDFYWLRDLAGRGIAKDPSVAVSNSFKKMADLKSYESSSSSTFSATVLDQEFAIKFSSQDKIDNKNELASSELKLKELSFPETDDMPPFVNNLNGATGELELITTKDQIYFKTPSFNDKWYLFDPASLSVPTGAFKNKEVPQGFQSVAGIMTTQQDFQLNTFESMAKSLKSAKREKDDPINKLPAYHFKYEIDLLKELKENEQFKDMPAFQVTILESFISKYVTFSSDVWISKKDFTVLKQETNFDIKANGEDFGQEGIYKLKMNSSILYNNLDQEIKITKPEDATKFDEAAITELYAVFLAKTPEEAQLILNNFKREQDMKTIREALEKYREKNNSYPIETDDSKDGNFMNTLFTGGFLKVYPKDPLHPDYYYQYVSTDGQIYSLTVAMQTPSGDLIVDFGSSYEEPQVLTNGSSSWSQAQKNASSVTTALVTYNDDCLAYPTSATTVTALSGGGGELTGDSSCDPANQTYAGSLPENTADIRYVYTSNGDTFSLTVTQSSSNKTYTCTEDGCN